MRGAPKVVQYTMALIGLLIAHSASVAKSADYDYCEVVDELCTDSAPRVFEGTTVNPPDGCWQRQSQYRCYVRNSYTNSCDGQDMNGWYPVSAERNNVVLLDGRTDLAPKSWDTFYANDAQSCSGDTSNGCGEPYNINPIGNVTNYAFNKLCYTDAVTPGCPVPDPTCTLASTRCTQEYAGMCLEQRQTYQCGTGNHTCVGVNTGQPVNALVGDSGFGNAVVSMAISQMIAEHSAIGPDGQLRVFGGEERQCAFITSAFEDFYTVVSTAATIAVTVLGGPYGGAVVGLLSSYGAGLLRTMKCCQADPGDVNINNAFCRQEDVDLAAARLKSRAIRVDRNPDNRGNDRRYNCFCDPTNVVPQLGDPTDCRNACRLYGSNAMVVDTQTWCNFPSLLARLIQEQGRAQLAQMAVGGAGGAQQQAVQFLFYGSGSGGWTPPNQINGHQVAFWQWDASCSGTDPAGAFSGTCPTDEIVWVATCSRGADCGDLSSSSINPAYGVSAEGWSSTAIRVGSSVPATVNEYVVVQGDCSKVTDPVTGLERPEQCNYRVHAWPAGVGGMLYYKIDLRWPLRFPAETGFNENFTFRSHDGTIVFQAQTWDQTDPAAPVPTLRVSTNNGATWSSPLVLPNPQPDLNYVLLPGPPAVTLYGGCENGECQYTAAYAIQVTNKPWGYYTWEEHRVCEQWIDASVFGGCANREAEHRVCDSRTGCNTKKRCAWCIPGIGVDSWVEYARVWHADCSGFTISELQALDFSKMDFSAYIESLAPTAPNPLAMVGQASDSAASLAGGGQPSPADSNADTFYLVPADPYPGEEMTLRARTSYTIVRPTGSVEAQVNTIHVDWGDGSPPSSAFVPAGAQYVELKHAYGQSAAGCAPTATSCTPNPAVNTEYSVTVTFNTTEGSYTNTGVVRVTVDAGTNAGMSAGPTSHGSTVRP